MQEKRQDECRNETIAALRRRECKRRECSQKMNAECRKGTNVARMQEKRPHECRTKHTNQSGKSLVNPKSTSNQSSQVCTVLQYPSRKETARMQNKDDDRETATDERSRQKNVDCRKGNNAEKRRMQNCRGKIYHLQHSTLVGTRSCAVYPLQHTAHSHERQLAARHTRVHATFLPTHIPAAT